jgi:small subunit ribosomal protein S4e
MARMGGRRHLRSFAAPGFWPIHRKERFWAPKPSPGPHPIEESIPLLIVIRDMLGYAKTSREARRIIGQGVIKVDGRPRRDYKYPVGLMDVIEITETGETYRVVPYPVSFLKLHPIPREEASFKLCRIEDKSTVKNGHIQLHLHDGRNHLIRVSDPGNPAEDRYRTLGTVKLAIPGQEILDYVPFEEGNIAIITSGRNVGRVGRILEVKPGLRRYRRIVTLEDKEGVKFQTSLSYIFIIGREEPLISLPEGAWK